MSLLTYRSGLSGMAAVCAAILAVGAVDLHAQNPDIPLDGPAFLPLPSSNWTPVAGWLPQNRVLVYDEAASQYELTYTTAWANVFTPSGVDASNYLANPASGASYTFGLTTGSVMNVGGLYPMGGAQYEVNVTGYDGPATSKLIFQIVAGYSLSSSDENARNADQYYIALPSLTIDGTTYNLDESGYTSQRGFGAITDAESPYFGHYGGLSLITMVWDLEDIGYTGVLEDFAINWTAGPHSVLYSAQVAIPEPSTWALIGIAGAAGVILRRRKSSRAA